MFTQKTLTGVFSSADVVRDSMGGASARGRVWIDRIETNQRSALDAHPNRSK